MNISTISRAMWFGSLAALIVAPLTLFYVDTTTLFPYISSKNFAWRALVEVAFVLWVGAALLDPQYRIDSKNPLVLGIGFFAIITLVANVLSPNPYLAFWSTVERMDGFIHLIHLMAYLVTFVGVLQTSKRSFYYLVYLLVISLTLGIIDWGGDGRIDSRLGNPIYLASVAMFGFFISAYLLMSRWVSLGKHPVRDFFRIEYVLMVLAAIASIVTIFKTSTRGALLGLVVGGLVASVLFLFTRGSEYKPFKIISGVVLLIVIGTSMLFFTSRETLSDTSFVQESSMLSRLVKISPEDRTTGFRLANWQMALEGVKERPFFGYGQEGYAEIFSEYFDVDALANAEQWYDRTHNVLLDALVFAGYPGLLAYLLVFILAIFLIYKKTDLDTAEKIVLVSLLAGYLAQNLVAFDSLASGVYIYALFGYIILLSKNEANREKEHVVILPLVAGLIISALFVSLLWWINFSILKPQSQLKSYVSYLIATNQSTEQNMKAAFPSFEHAMTHQSFVQRELVLQGTREFEKFLNPEIPIEVRAPYLESVLSGIRSLETSNDTRMLLSAGTFLSNVGASTQGLPYLEAALERSPNKPLIIVQNAVAHERVGDIERAAELFSELQAVAPQFSLTDRFVREFRERLERRGE